MLSDSSSAAKFGEQSPCNGSPGSPEWRKDYDLSFESSITKGLAQGWARIKPHLLHRICKHPKIRAFLPLCQNNWNFYDTTFNIMVGRRDEYPSKDQLVREHQPQWCLKLLQLPQWKVISNTRTLLWNEFPFSLPWLHKFSTNSKTKWWPLGHECLLSKCWCP